MAKGDSGENKSIQIERKVIVLEDSVKHLDYRVDELDKKVNAVFKRMDELRDSFHKHEIQTVQNLSEMKTMLSKLSNDIKWYGRIPTLVFSSLSFLTTLLILLKVLGLLKVGS